MKVWSAILPLVVVSALMLSGCGEHEELPGESRSPPPSLGASESSTPCPVSVSPFPSPIPDETLLAEFHTLPVAPGGQIGSGFTVEGSAGSSFYGVITRDEFVSFYQRELAASGWTSELGPIDDPGGTGLQWSLTKGDFRLMILLNLSSANSPPGAVVANFIIKPIWLSGLSIATITPGPIITFCTLAPAN